MGLNDRQYIIICQKDKNILPVTTVCDIVQ